MVTSHDFRTLHLLHIQDNKTAIGTSNGNILMIYDLDTPELACLQMLIVVDFLGFCYVIIEHHPRIHHKQQKSALEHKNLVCRFYIIHLLILHELYRKCISIKEGDVLNNLLPLFVLVLHVPKIETLYQVILLIINEFKVVF